MNLFLYLQLKIISRSTPPRVRAPHPESAALTPVLTWALWPSVPILLKSVWQALTYPLSPVLLTPSWENGQNEQEWFPGQTTEPKLQLAWNVLLGLAGYLLLLTHYASNCLPPTFNASQPKLGGVSGQVNLASNSALLCMSSVVIPDKLLTSPSNLLVKWQGSPWMREFVSYHQKIARHPDSRARHAGNGAWYKCRHNPIEQPQ